MPDRSAAYWVRWFCLPTLLVAIIMAGLLLGGCLVRILPFSLPDIWLQSGVGFTCAIVWIVVAFRVIPDHARVGLIACFVLGSVISWVLNGKVFWPDYSGQTRLPTYVSWAGGILAVVGILVAEQRRRNLVAACPPQKAAERWGETTMRKGVRIWRVLAASAILVVAAGGVIWHQDLLRPLWFNNATKDSLMLFIPYRHEGPWVFDVLSPNMLHDGPDCVVMNLEVYHAMAKDTVNRLRLLCSVAPFPGYTDRLTWRRADKDGNWYQSETYPRVGWFCFGLREHPLSVPKLMYVKAEEAK